MDIQNKLDALARSKFRSSFHLKEKDKEYIKEKGWETIERHAKDFITKRLAPAHPFNDGHQTPWKGHPVFIAQHATATCCRECLYKWHHIAKNKELNGEEIDYIVNLIKAYLEREMKP